MKELKHLDAMSLEQLHAHLNKMIEQWENELVVASMKEAAEQEYFEKTGKWPGQELLDLMNEIQANP